MYFIKKYKLTTNYFSGYSLLPGPVKISEAKVLQLYDLSALFVKDRQWPNYSATVTCYFHLNNYKFRATKRCSNCKKGSVML